MKCLAPVRSPALREAVLWRAVIEGWTHPKATNGAPAGPHRDRVVVALRRDPVRDGDVSEGEGRAAMEWIRALDRAVGELGDLAPAAMAWAAVDAWNDLGVAPWTRLASALERLAQRVEPEGAAVLAPAAADRLRAHMQRVSGELWPRPAGRAGDGR